MSRISKAESHATSRLSAEGIRDEQRRSGLSRRYLYLVITFCLLVATVVGFLLYSEYQEQLEYWQEKLTRVAGANQHLLENWVRERNEDAQLLAGFPCAEISALSGAKNPTRQPLCQQRLHGDLNSVARTYSYAGAYILDLSGRVLAQSDASPPVGTAMLKEVVSDPQTGSGARAVTVPATGDRAEYSQVAFVAPIRQHQPLATTAKVAGNIGYVVLLTRPEAIASLLLADRATQTGETVLLSLQAGKPVFISPLRHWKAEASLPRPPDGSPGRTIVTEKRELFGAYRDYRGVPVLAAARFLPVLGWGMVTKVDKAEALAGFRQTFILGITVGLLAVLTIVSVTAAWLRHLRVQRLQLDLTRGKQTEQKLRQSEERFWVALQNSPVAVFNQDRDLRYTWIHNVQPPGRSRTTWARATKN